MKKYFLLFAASFVAFEAGLIAGSSSSYGMEPEYDKEHQSTIIHNSQGQKIWETSLHREDPAADNGKITILLGTSTAGKTTLIDQLTCMEPYPLNYDLDRRIRVAYDSFIKKHAREEFQAISEVTQQFIIDVAGDDNDRLRFKQDITLEQKEKAEKALITLRKKIENDDFPEDLSVDNSYDMIYKQIIHHSQEKKQTIFDVIEIKQLNTFLEMAKNIVVAPIEIKLLFCPLNELAKRLEMRNKKAIEEGRFSNKRGGDPLWQYTKLYRPKQNSNETTLETLRRSEAEAAFHQHLSTDMENKPLSMFLENLGFTSPEIEEVEITSRFKGYSDIIYSDTSSNW